MPESPALADASTALVLENPVTLGRPLSLTADLVDKIARLTCEGHYVTVVCQALKVSRSNYYRWLKDGEADAEAGRGTPEAYFWDIVKTAEAQGEIAIGRKWLAGGKDWPAYATWQERKYPDRWARRSDSSDSPKVVVQIGVKDSDVQVQIQSYAAESHSLSPGVSISQSDSMQALTVTDRQD